MSGRGGSLRIGLFIVQTRGKTALHLGHPETMFGFKKRSGGPEIRECRLTHSYQASKTGVSRFQYLIAGLILLVGCARVLLGTEAQKASCCLVHASAGYGEQFVD
jgi:hypothetical protein